ncbi:MAG: aldehyde dehydrogenase family protein [bacterium]|nr:aldehyde dehydrogenase family protein [bacterium]
MDKIDKPYLVLGEPKPGGEKLPILCPYDGEEIGHTRIADNNEVESAAAGAYDFWKRKAQPPLYERIAILKRLSALVEENNEGLSKVLALESGKNIAEARGEVARCVYTIKVAAEEAPRMHEEVIALDAHPAGEGRTGIVRRFSRGPVLGITPFNFPINLVAHKLAPAIAVGAPIVIKPASTTPFSAIMLAELAFRAGLPGEMVSVLPMAGAAAEVLVKDDRFAVLTFTGSPDIGWWLKGIAGFKVVSLELGGNAGMIVHRDADVGYAARRAAAGGFGVCGQSCISVQRIYAHSAIYDEFAEVIIAEAESRIIGHPLDEKADMGSMITMDDAERAKVWLDEAVSAGANVLTGGEREGTRFQPTIVENVPHNLPLNALEVFAPILVLHRYDDFKEAVALCDDSDFGLQAGVFTQDMGRILYAYENLHVGGVIMNDIPSFRIDHMPYGGAKQSGIGREGLKYAMEEYTEPRLMVINREGLSGY